MRLSVGAFLVLFFALSSAYVASEAAATTSGIWTQTTQADFQSDSLANLDASSSSGYVQLPSPAIQTFGYDVINRSSGNSSGQATFLTGAQSPVSGAIVKYRFYSNAGCRTGFLCFCVIGGCPDDSFQLDVFRDNGTNYVLVGQSPTIGAVFGDNELSLAQPIQVQKGDLLGFYLGTNMLLPYSASNSLSQTHSGRVTTDTPKSDWSCAFSATFCGGISWSVQADIQARATGTLLSTVKDTGGTSTWEKLNWTANIPLGTSFSISTRTSNDSIAWSPWSSNYTASGKAIASPGGRYVQYQAVLTNQYNSTQSPSVHYVAITFNTTPPAGPSFLSTYGPWLILAAVIAGFAVAVFITKPKTPRTG